jgi:hypothetical protein
VVLRNEEDSMSDVYRAVVGLRYPDSIEGFKQALAAKTDEDFATIKWTRSEPGETVPDYVIKGSPWLVEQGKVEKSSGPAPAPAPAPEIAKKSAVTK